MEYRLYGTVDDKPKLASIDTPGKAEALLLSLNLTIAPSEGAVVPSDLAVGLDQICGSCTCASRGTYCLGQALGDQIPHFGSAVSFLLMASSAALSA